MTRSPQRRSWLGRALAASLVVHAAAAFWLQGTATATHAPMAPELSVQVRVVELPPAPHEVPEAVPEPPEPVTEPKPIARPVAKPKPKPEPAPVAAEPTPEPAEEAAEPAPPVVAAASSEAQVVAALPVPSVAPGPSIADELQRWRALVKQKITAQRRYPAMARRRGTEGMVRLVIAVGPSGEVKSIETPGRSPQVLSHEARRAVERAAPFAPPPGGARKIKFNMRFDLDG
ncbi:MAG: TonB family protein [Myxococcota bacterium]